MSGMYIYYELDFIRFKWAHLVVSIMADNSKHFKWKENLAFSKASELVWALTYPSKNKKFKRDSPVETWRSSCDFTHFLAKLRTLSAPNVLFRSATSYLFHIQVNHKLINMVVNKQYISVSNKKNNIYS